MPAAGKILAMNLLLGVQQVPDSMLAEHVTEHGQAKPLSLSVRLLWF